MNGPSCLVLALAVAGSGGASVAPPRADFDKAAASTALAGAATAAKACKKAGGPKGAGKVKVTFAKTGEVTAAAIDDAPFAGTPVGACVAAAFRAARIPPFDGAPVTVSKTFTID